MEEGKRIIEVDGVKMEIDLRTARVVDTYHVGDNVKILRKRYNGYEILPGAIVGFTEFRNRPALELLAIEPDGSVIFLTYAAKNDGEQQDIEIAPFNKFELLIDRASIMDKLNRCVEVKENELRDATAKRNAFVQTFEKVFAAEMV